MPQEKPAADRQQHAAIQSYTATERLQCQAVDRKALQVKNKQQIEEPDSTESVWTG